MPLHAVLLDANTLGEDISLECITQIDGIHCEVYSDTKPEDVLSRVIKADIIFTNKVMLSREVLIKANNVKYIGVLATGVNCIDIRYCHEQGIMVKNVEGYGTASVTQHALMLLLNLVCKSATQINHVKNNAWQQANAFCIPTAGVMELAGKTAAIVGYGELGQAFATLLEAMGMKVIKTQVPGRNTSNRVPLDEALSQSDVVSLHCLLSDSTQQMIDHARLGQMKQGAYLINTSRGGLIDEQALLDNLVNGHLAGAGLDVLSVEPPSQGNILLDANLDNLVITPHWAWGALESRQRLLKMAADNVKSFLNMSVFTAKT